MVRCSHTQQRLSTTRWVRCVTCRALLGAGTLCLFLTNERLEYEKLHRALKKSHEQEKRLIKKCRELNGEIVNNAAKVQTALKLSQEDQATIGSLRKEIEKAWTMVDVAHEKEGGISACTAATVGWQRTGCLVCV